MATTPTPTAPLTFTSLEAPALMPVPTTLTPDQQALYQKMHRILQRIRPLPKRGYNAVDDYSFIQDSDVTELMRQEFAKEHLVLLHDVLRIDHIDSLYTLWIQCTLLDTTTGASYTTRTVGQGIDMGDKGIPKAMTAAIKHFLIKHFAIASQSDLSLPVPTESTPAMALNHPYAFYLTEGALQPENHPNTVMTFRGTGTRTPDDPSGTVPCIAYGISALPLARALKAQQPIQVLSSRWSTEDNALVIMVIEEDSSPASQPVTPPSMPPAAEPPSDASAPSDQDVPPIDLTDASEASPEDSPMPQSPIDLPDQLDKALKAPLWHSAQATGITSVDDLLRIINAKRATPLQRVTQLTNQEAQRLTQEFQRAVRSST